MPNAAGQKNTSWRAVRDGVLFRISCCGIPIYLMEKWETTTLVDLYAMHYLNCPFGRVAYATDATSIR